MMGRLLVAGLVGVCAVLVLAPDVFRLDRHAPFPGLLAFRPVTAVCLLLVAAGIVVARRSWWPSAAALAAIALPVAVFVLLSRAIPMSTATPKAAADPRTLSVLSFNVYNGRADIASLAHIIAAERPDLVVLPEAGERYRNLLHSVIGGLEYNSWTTGRPDEPDVEGIVVLATPSMGALHVRVLNRETKFSWIELTGGVLGAVRVVAVHTAAPVSGSVPAWRADLAALGRWCHSTPPPVLLVGDFNATLDHPELRSLDCTDVAAAAGQGLVGTWPTSLPAWVGTQIDHVLVGGGITPNSARVLDLPGSDHRAVLARVTLPVEPAPGPAR
jgi:endonuclease/exonuclease/phosphatase (EEP) superfamily protein YafD